MKRLLLSLALALALPGAARADINLLAPNRVVNPDQPLILTLVVSGEAKQRSYAVPDVLRVTLTPDLGAVVRIDLKRTTAVPAEFDLHPGELLRFDYAGAVPANLRGQVRIETLDFPAPVMIVRLSTSAPAEALAATKDDPLMVSNSTASFLPPADAAKTSRLGVRDIRDPNMRDEGRLSFHEPLFFIAGHGDEGNAQIQLSFKVRLHEPANKLSRKFFDNLYFAYSQRSFWDLEADSKPFIDTSYMPSLFYQTPSLGFTVAGNPVALAFGYEHESNGKDGVDSRSIDTLFVRPRFVFGDTAGFFGTFEPKFYVYLEKGDNPDIQRYRGYGDMRFTYGANDNWQLAWTLRKGTKSDAFSSDLQATYPLNRWFPGVAGYLMAQYFAGYGQTMLFYNQSGQWALRLGYALSR